MSRVVRTAVAGLTVALLAAALGQGQGPAPGLKPAPGQLPAPAPGLKPAPGQLPAQAPVAKPAPRLEPIAETKLLMEGLAYANFRGLEKLLMQKPADAQAWTFARGQALLLAETANLLMLRPPKSQGQAVWFERATELRQQATQLAVAVAKLDYPASRAGLQQVSATCNRCHQTFRVDAEIVPFLQPPPPKVE
jgi:hypothetical protein